ncbi:hypothetical protein E2C01_062986 [Portunus trituberculatus]|uniref:Uncharacterized protein n=1 Tax=Portunus trituberculatus TaxID=210409 RepID=A0A5B7HFJ3_PORTR|nr:hypothetical protein [Portunus trituberculatus]
MEECGRLGKCAGRGGVHRWRAAATPAPPSPLVALLPSSVWPRLPPGALGRRLAAVSPHLRTCTRVTESWRGRALSPCLPRHEGRPKQQWGEGRGSVAWARATRDAPVRAWCSGIRPVTCTPVTRVPPTLRPPAACLTASCVCPLARVGVCVCVVVVVSEADTSFSLQHVVWAVVLAVTVTCPRTEASLAPVSCLLSQQVARPGRTVLLLESYCHCSPFTIQLNCIPVW